MAVRIVGSINVDVISRVAHLPAPGETVIAAQTLRLPGGKGANQAVAAARMGASVTMCAAVGDDADGRWLLGELAAAGVDVRAVTAVAGVPTGAAYISVDSHAENQIVVAPGANAHFLPGALAPADAAQDVVLAQLEVPVATIAAAFTRPARLRILNAAPALADAAVLLDQADVLIVNEHELAALTQSAPVVDICDAVVAARRLMKRMDQIVIVTLGAQGAVAVRADGHAHAPAVSVDPLDTVGAGDCFCGSLAALLDERLSVEQALPIANTAAALCTLLPGAVPAMPDRAAVEAARLVPAT